MDPERELREPRVAYEDVPTAQNQMRLASALLEAGAAEEAARTYQACLKGPFAADVEICFGAARAFVECQRYVEAISHLETIRNTDPESRAEAVSILLARCYAGVSRKGEARNEFESVVTRFGSFEARAEYAIWALAIGDMATAARLQTEIDRTARKWTPPCAHAE